MNDIIRILQVREDTARKSKYYFTAQEVADYHEVSLNAVYTSRKLKTDKLDKLLAFSKLREKITIADAEKLKG